MKELRLLPGNALVKVDTRYDADSGGIALPEMLKRHKLYTGVVIDDHFTARDKNATNLTTLKGERVLLEHHLGRHLEDDLYVVPITYKEFDAKTGKKVIGYRCSFVAFGEGFVPSITGTGGERRRCRYCGPADSTISQNNIYLTRHARGFWYCPRCRKNEMGDKTDPNDIVD